MSLPKSEKAYVPAEKLKDYLLSKTHAVGKAKAKFFRTFGYTERNSGRLAADLLSIAASEGTPQVVVSDYGTKYIMDGDLVTPTGATVRLRTVWVAEPHDERPRFVTAYPA